MVSCAGGLQGVTSQCAVPRAVFLMLNVTLDRLGFV